MVPLLLFLLACAAVYVGAVNAAFSATMRLSLRLVAERIGREGHLGRYLDDPILLFVPIRLLLGMIVIVAAVLVASIATPTTFEDKLFTIVIVAVFVVVCEHLLPFAVIRRDPERALALLLPSFEYVLRVLSPLTMILVGLMQARRERSGSAPVVSPESPNPETAAETARAAAANNNELLDREERRLLRSVAHFGDILVREVMTPRPDVVAIPVTATLGELRRAFQEQEYSRMPVFNENLDNILGFVFVKDLLLVQNQSETRSLSDTPELIRPAYVVPETKRVAELLKEFQRNQVQSAIVVDEYGGTAGLVTLEDLLEEIVGEIRDEYDEEADAVVDEGNGSYLFSGRVDIDEMAERLGVEVQRAGFETVGGYLMSYLGRVPAVGEMVEIDGLLLEVIEAERRRITKVRIRKAQGATARTPSHAT